MHRHPTHLDSKALRVKKHWATWQVPSEEAKQEILDFTCIHLHWLESPLLFNFKIQTISRKMSAGEYQTKTFWILCGMSWIICLYLGMSKTWFLSLHRIECLYQPLHGNQGSLLCFSSGSQIPAHVTMHANGSRWQWGNGLCLMSPLAASAAAAVVDAKTTLSLELNQDAFWTWRQWKEST